VDSIDCPVRTEVGLPGIGEKKPMNIKRGMKEAFAVTGYLPKEIAEQLGSGKIGGASVDLRAESGSDLVVMRVKMTEISEVRMGPSAKGETLVQIILAEKAQVETVVSTEANLQGLRRFNDPVVQRLTALATAKSIAV
jgi:hypothetical protein